MKKLIIAILSIALTCVGCLFVSACNGVTDTDYGTMSVSDVTVEYGKTATIVPTFTNSEYAEQPTYSFEGESIAVEGNTVTGLVANTQTAVTATTSHHTATFTVSVGDDYGVLQLVDVELTVGNRVLLNPVFSNELYEEEVDYSFDGSDIVIEDGMVYGVVPGTQTTVTATTSHHTTTFKVTVNYMQAVLSNPTGAEAKYAMATPDAENWVLSGRIEVSSWRENGFTRLSAFAFNASDNSWYNIERFADGETFLYARFNGVERYNIRLFNTADEGIIVDGKITYTFALLKQGEATSFFINGKKVCCFLEEEMKGYSKLGNVELTACANRDNAGEYEVALCDAYFDLEGGEKYAQYAQFEDTLMQFGDIVLAAEDGSERKFVISNMTLPAENFVYSTTVVVNTYEEAFTRTSSFAFNVSDNSWYNIEMNGDGSFILYGRFNGVEKYHIYLFNKNDPGIIVDDKITYTVDLLKKGENTAFFVNGKHVATFTADELNGYAKLNGFEITSATDAVWRDGTAYSVTYKNTCIKNESSQEYQELLVALTGAKEFEDASLVSSNGAEQKFVIAPNGLYSTYAYSVISAKITVNSFDKAAWFRSSAIAFNGSDNSWYNIELGGDGNVTLYARFNGVEKYHIHLFNINDEGVMQDGKLVYTLTVLRKGQATWLFINDRLVCSFTAQELNGYPVLDSVEITSCADRSGKAFDVTVSEVKIEGALSESYKKYSELAE